MINCLSLSRPVSFTYIQHKPIPHLFDCSLTLPNSSLLQLAYLPINRMLAHALIACHPFRMVMSGTSCSDAFDFLADKRLVRTFFNWQRMRKISLGELLKQTRVPILVSVLILLVLVIISMREAV